MFLRYPLRGLKTLLGSDRGYNRRAHVGMVLKDIQMMHMPVEKWVLSHKG